MKEEILIEALRKIEKGEIETSKKTGYEISPAYGSPFMPVYKKRRMNIKDAISIAHHALVSYYHETESD